MFLGLDWTINNNNGETVTAGFFGGLGVFQEDTEHLLIGNMWIPITYGGGVGNTKMSTSIPYVTGETVRIVAEFTILNGGSNNDTFKMWINPDLSDFGVPDAMRTDMTLDNFSQFVSRAGNGSGSATITDFIVSTTFAESLAVPVPSTAVFLDLGGFSLMLRRRISS